jgi:hypothetical protein
MVVYRSTCWAYCIFLDNEPVALSSQLGRKCSTNYEFISHETASKVKDFILSLPLNPEQTYSIANIDRDVSGTYSVAFVDQLSTSHGFYDGYFCTIISKNGENIEKQEITVKLENNLIKTIDITEFKIPLLLSQDYLRSVK